MWSRQFISKIGRTRIRCFHHEFTKPASGQKSDEKPDKTETVKPHPLLRQPKYKTFRDEDSPIIFDVEEERQRQETESQYVFDINEMTDLYQGLNLERGINGVFDIEDLIDVLRKENAEDIFVCSVPKEIKYVDYIVICSGRSYRHMLATADMVRRMFKIKRNKDDVVPKIEGEKSRKWMAMDLGNIALHVFAPDVREEYDLESLWAIGPEYDHESNKPQDPLVEIFERYTFSIDDKSKT